ncbi:surfeit locus protein 1-like isoform X2 [Nematostella vectensis]|uniref:surfeit locus protein 1-like isoform X2 n=1 Tax=Nematostella vectensis TaxID=45351 RepID=UPI00207710C2|nr:surfeit locus protein 1-like isoform X2 [Nematostella vectensis]
MFRIGQRGLCLLRSNLKGLVTRCCQTQAQQDSGSKLHLLMLVIPVSAFGLGTWQVFRLQWKLGLIKSLEERTTAPPLDPPENLDDLDTTALEYRRIRLTGQFNHEQEFHVFPRSLYEGSAESGGLGRQPKSGAHVITPFTLAQTGETILVNRGWVPKAKIDAEKRPEGQVSGEVTITGFIRKNDKRAPFAPKDDASRNRWHHRDAEAMAEVADCLPIQVDADAVNPRCYRHPGTTYPRICSNRSYFQYFFVVLFSHCFLFLCPL